MRARLDDKGRIKLDGTIDEINAVLELPGLRAKDLTFSPTRNALVMLHNVLDTLVLDPALQVAWHSEQRERINPVLELREATDADGPTHLYAYQRVGAKFLAAAQRAILADEPGLGKTLQAIEALRLLPHAFPVLVVCPKSVKQVWFDEFEKWWGSELTVRIIDGTAAQRKALLKPGADVYIIGKDALRLHSKLATYGGVKVPADEAGRKRHEADKKPKELNALSFGTVIADEAHHFLQPSSKQTRALWQVAKQSENLFLLTGTPISSDVDDLWSLLHAIDDKGWNTRSGYIQRYANAYLDFDGFLKIDGLNDRHKEEFFSLVDPLLLRRPKKAVLTQLPDKIYSYRYSELGTKEAKAYHDMRKDLLTQLESGTLLAINPLTNLIRLMQFASSYARVTPDGAVLLDEPSSKLDVMEEVLDERGDEPMIIFAESRQLIEMAHRRILGRKTPRTCGLITGVVDSTTRADNVAKFQSGELNTLLITLGAGGEGLTLTAASTVLRLQRSWSNIKNLQGEDRAHRIGQREVVEIIEIISSGTIEVHQLRALQRKGQRMEDIVRDEDTIRQWLIQ